MKRLLAMLLAFTMLFANVPVANAQSQHKYIHSKSLTVQDNKGKKVQEELTFVLKHLNDPNETVQEYTTVNGKLPPMKMRQNDDWDQIYILSLKENNKYEMKDVIMSQLIDKQSPIDESDENYGAYIDDVVVKLKGTEDSGSQPSPSQPPVTPSPSPEENQNKNVRKASVFLGVKYKGDDVDEELTFKLEHNGVTTDLTLDNTSSIFLRGLE